MSFILVLEKLFRAMIPTMKGSDYQSSNRGSN